MGYAQSVDSMQFYGLEFKYQTADFRQFNEQAAALSYPGLEENVVEFGFNHQARQGRWLYHSGIFAGLAAEENGSLNADFTEYLHLGAALELSWSAIRSDNWFVGPMLASYFQWSRLVLRPQNQVNTLGAALGVEYQKFTRFNVPVAVGLNAQYYIHTKAATSIMLGVQAGYRLDDEEGWRVDGAVPWENSGLSAQGWFVAFRIGRSL
jgi:hypothetical protein